LNYISTSISDDLSNSEATQTCAKHVPCVLGQSASLTSTISMHSSPLENLVGITALDVEALLGELHSALSKQEAMGGNSNNYRVNKGNFKGQYMRFI